MCIENNYVTMLLTDMLFNVFNYFNNCIPLTLYAYDMIIIIIVKPGSGYTLCNLLSWQKYIQTTHLINHLS